MLVNQKEREHDCAKSRCRDSSCKGSGRWCWLVFVPYRQKNEGKRESNGKSAKVGSNAFLRAAIHDSRHHGITQDEKRDEAKSSCVLFQAGVMA